MLTFDPLNQSDGGGGALRVTEGLCTVDDPSTCVPDPDASTHSTTYATQAAGACLTAIAGTLGPTPYLDLIAIAPNAPTGSCFAGAATQLTLVFELGLQDGATEFFPIPLEDVRIAGEWQGVPATSIGNGLLRGFLPMRVADEQSADFYIPWAGTININLGRDVLPDRGNAHGCGGVTRSFPAGGTSGSNVHCYGGDARDLRDPALGASYDNCGWWFYFNFTGAWVENAEGF
jgi:hypothetical protein